jgi:ribose transport system permease protein
MGSRLRELTARYGTVFALIALVVVFQIQTGNFLSSGNIAAVLNQAAVLALLAGGLTLVLVLGQFDLSIGWVASLGGMIATGLMSQRGVSLPVAVAAALVAGAVIGLINGLLVTVLRINALLATLATASVISGLSSWYSIRPFSTDLAPSFIEFGITTWGWLPAPALAAGLCCFVAWVFLQHTSAGRRMYAVGGNREAARIAGVHVERTMVGAFIACSVMASAGGVLLASQLGSGQPQSAVGLLLGAFAAVFLGSATWREGQFHIAGTVIGVLILGVVFSGLSLLNTPSYLNDIATGIILIVAVGASARLRPRT